MPPTGTVRVAGTNAKLVMSIALAPCGAVDADTVGELLATGAGAGAPVMPCPAIPGVVLTSGPKVIDGDPCGAGLDPEQPETSSTAAAAATAVSVVSERWDRDMTGRTSEIGDETADAECSPIDRKVGYTKGCALGRLGRLDWTQHLDRAVDLTNL